MLHRLLMSTAVFIILSAAVSASHCASNEKNCSMKGTNAECTNMCITAEQLAQYTGSNGKPAYVAANGTIYDVTAVPAWKSGKHNGGAVGTDISEIIKKAPHGNKVLEKLTPVGHLSGSNACCMKSDKGGKGKKKHHKGAKAGATESNR